MSRAQLFPAPAAVNGPWATPALLNGWAAAGPPWAPPGYSTDAIGAVRLRGVVANGPAGAFAILQLPAATRPVDRLRFTTSSSSATLNGYAIVDVLPTGDVYYIVGAAGAGAGVSVSLDGIAFLPST